MTDEDLQKAILATKDLWYRAAPLGSDMSNNLEAHLNVLLDEQARRACALKQNEPTPATRYYDKIVASWKDDIPGDPVLRALKFYASNDAYCCVFTGPRTSHLKLDDRCPVLVDDGAMAKEALQAYTLNAMTIDALYGILFPGEPEKHGVSSLVDEIKMLVKMRDGE